MVSRFLLKYFTDVSPIELEELRNLRQMFDDTFVCTLILCVLMSVVVSLIRNARARVTCEGALSAIPLFVFCFLISWLIEIVNRYVYIKIVDGFINSFVFCLASISYT